MEKRVIRMGVIGLGRWGPNHLRVFSEQAGSRCIACCDSDARRLEAAKRRAPGVACVSSAGELLEREDVDAVVIATPASTHVELTRAAIAAGKDVLCEKPLSTSPRECRELGEAAKAQGRILMVGHVFLFNPGILRLKQSNGSGEIGELRYLHAVRTNLGPVRTDVGVVADLATHDISILNFLTGASPEVLSAVGGRWLQERFEDVAFINLRYPGGVLASIHVSWLDPVKVRRITAVGSERMIVWDDLAARGPVEIYDRRVVREDYGSFGEFQMLVREGAVTAPHVEAAEPLRVQAEAFLEAVRTRRPSVSDANFAAGVAEVLEAAGRLMRKESGG